MASLNIHNKLGRIALLCLVWCFTCFAQEKLVMLAPPKAYKDLLEKAQTCSKETGIPAAALKQIIDWPMDDSRASKEFFQCVCYNTRYTDKDGHFIIDSFLELLTLTKGTKEEVIKALAQCNQVTLDDPVETAFAIGDCAHKYFTFGVEKKEN